MKTSQAGIDLIKRYEGFVSKPYLCPAGVWTVGYGSTRGITRDTPPVTKEQAEEILRRDVEFAEAAVMRLCPALKKQNRFDAIVSFTFNLGSAALQRSTLRQKINRNEHLDVPAELLKWVWAGGRRLPGLVARRAAEGVMYGSLSPALNEELHRAAGDLMAP
jgi:lysozyme